VFSAGSSKLTLTFRKELPHVTMVNVKDTIAEVDMRDLIDGVTYSFYLLFVKDRDGIWRIRNF
jgi:hypothetical protein